MYQKRMVELYATTGRSQEANSLLATVLKDNPKDVDAIAMRAALMLNTGNRDQINIAANDLQALVTKTPQNHLYRYNLARAMVAKGDLEAARLQLEEADQAPPRFSGRARTARPHSTGSRRLRQALKGSEEILGMDRTNLQGHLIRAERSAEHERQR